MMKKIFLVLSFLMLGASSVTAQQGTRSAGLEVPFEATIGAGWYGIRQTGSNIAEEYQYGESGPAGLFEMEWAPLPHRFMLESYFLNPKDYFGEMDYAFKDILLFNGYTRGMFHNLNHYTFGIDDPTTQSPTYLDLNPTDPYGIENRLNRAFLRLKTPDFPFHLYADIRTINREGTIQQRFYRMTDLAKVSRSRDIDWDTQEARVGMNAHLGPIEADYSHMEKKFEAAKDKILHDTTSGTAIPHNLVPDLKSSSDTVKLHTTYSGKLVLSGTYVNGDSKNEDSGAQSEFTNAAGDIMFMPVTSVIITLKFRRHELDVTNPDSVTISGLQPIENVRDSISSIRDVVTGTLRYRATNKLTFKGEYVTDTTDRTRGDIDTSDFWPLPESTTRNTARLGFTYRVMNRMTLRGDYSRADVTNPAYDIDPDKASNARASIAWSPTSHFNTMLSFGMIRESRDQLSAPLGGGSRDAERDQALLSATMIMGSRASVTMSYAYFKNRVEQTLTFRDGSNAFVLEPIVPNFDIAHVGSLAFTVAPSDWMNLVASASTSNVRGAYDLDGNVPFTGAHITAFTELKAVDTVYTAGLEMQHSRYVASEVRYQYRHYDDRIDDAQDGTMKLALATLSLKW